MEVVHNAYVSGVPKAQPRPRMTISGHVYNPDSARYWKETVAAYFKLHRKPVITVPVFLEVVFFFPIPQRLKNKGLVPHVTKPDVDNLLKAVMDAMTDAGVWKDDALVYGTSAEKRYSRGFTGVRILVKTGIWGGDE